MNVIRSEIPYPEASGQIATEILFCNLARLFAGEDYKKDCSVKRETAPEKLCLDCKACVPFRA